MNTNYVPIHAGHVRKDSLKSPRLMETVSTKVEFIFIL